MEVCWVQWWGVLEMATGYKLQVTSCNHETVMVHFRLYIVYEVVPVYNIYMQNIFWLCLHLIKTHFDMVHTCIQPHTTQTNKLLPS